MSFPCSKEEVASIIETGDFTDDQYQRLYEYYLASGEMPYGTAKARDGDPYQWIYDQLESEFS